MPDDAWLVVGLGNPGAQYAGNRHNVGRMVVDELASRFGDLRLKTGGGHGGHNGVRDIAAVLGTPEFPRVRVGIGRPPGRQPAADFVLKDFTPTERKELPLLVGDAADAVVDLAGLGLEPAQQRWNAPRDAR